VGARKSTTARVERMDRHQRRQAALKANGGVHHVDPNDAQEAAMAAARAAAVSANNDAIAAAARIAALPPVISVDDNGEPFVEVDEDVLVSAIAKDNGVDDDVLDELIDETNSSAVEH
jgi:hypothetical protein